MTDYIIRATAAEGQIRAFAATTRDLVEAARDAHNTSPVATAALGRLLTAGAMMGIMMKGEKDMSFAEFDQTAIEKAIERHLLDYSFITLYYSVLPFALFSFTLQTDK